MKPKHPGIPPVLVAIPLVFWTIAVLWWGISTQALWEQQSYRQVTARVEQVRYKVGALDRLTHNCPTTNNHGPQQVYVTYSYKVAGKHYTATAYDAHHKGELFCDEAPARERVAQLKKAGTIPAFYSPSAPQRAVLQKENQGEIIAVWVLLGIAGLIGWSWFVRQLLRHRRYRRQMAEQ